MCGAFVASAHRKTRPNSAPMAELIRNVAPLIGAVVISLIALFEVRRIHKPRPPETPAE